MIFRLQNGAVPHRNTHKRFVARVRVVVTALVVVGATLPAGFAQRTSPASTENLREQAHASVASGQWEAADATYQKAIAAAPKDPTLRVELGAVLMRMGRLPEAIATYEEALQISPHDLPAEIGLAQAFRAVPNYEEAQHVLEIAIREHPKAGEPLALMGDVEIQLQTYDAAIGHLRAALAVAPQDLEARNLLAAAYKAKGDLTSALGELQKVLARDPQNALAHFLRAEIYADQNRDDLALPDARKVVELQPENLPGRVVLGKILVRAPQGMPPNEIAARCKEAVTALGPVAADQTRGRDSETLFLLSRAYRCAGEAEKADQAAAAFEAASQAERNTKENEAQAMHLVQEANETAMKNNLPGALDLLQQALAKDPNSGGAYSMLAKLYYSAGDIDKASEAIAKALERGPHQPDFLYVQGKILEKQGREDEALASFAQTTLINPKESDAYFEIGAIYQKRNDRARAIAAYKKAVELAPDDPDYRRALASLSGGAAVSP